MLIKFLTEMNSLSMAIDKWKSDKEIVKLSNALTSAAYSLTKNEKRIVYVGLDRILAGKIQKNDLGQYRVDIPHAEFLAIFGSNSRNASRDILNAAKTLNSKEVVFYKDDEGGYEDGEFIKGEGGISWTNERATSIKRGLTTVYFNARLIKIIEKIDNNFTMLLLSDLSKLENPHTMRLYDTLKQWENNSKVTLGIDWIISRYELPKSYSRMNDFRRRFLKPSVEEITKNTELNVTYVENHMAEGQKKTKSITFFISNKKNKKASSSHLVDNMEPYEAAKETYQIIMQRKILPSQIDIDNMLKHIDKLFLDEFELGSEFKNCLADARAEIQTLEDFHQNLEQNCFDEPH